MQSASPIGAWQMKFMERYKRQQKRKTILTLEELVKGIRSGRLIVSETGFWDSRTDNSINFKIKVISRDSAKEIKKFEQLS